MAQLIKTEQTNLVKAETLENEEMHDEGAVAFLKKEEDPIDEPLVAQSDAIIKKFTSLWFACYFERKLTRQKVCETDLNQIIGDLVTFFCTDENRVDFRRATPMLAGLHNLFVKRLAYLVRDTENILKEMSDPIKLENTNPDKKARQGGSSGARANNFKFNPTKFDWFVDGLGKDRLDALQQKLEQTIMRDIVQEDHLEMSNRFQQLKI